MKTSSIDSVWAVLPGSWTAEIRKAGISDFEELRVRIGQPICVYYQGITKILYGCIATAEDITNIVLCASKYSVHSYEASCEQGYLPLSGGGRIGICGEFLQGKFSLQNITSLNIRLAHECIGVGEAVYQKVQKKPCNLLLVGPPCSGKTTMIRDLARLYSCDGYRVGIADERGELFPSQADFHLGIHVDRLSGIPKADAIERLVRVMNPQIICFDELGSQREAQSVRSAFSGGVYMICSLHAQTQRQMETRIRRFFGEQPPFDWYVILNQQYQIEKMVSGSYAENA